MTRTQNREDDEEENVDDIWVYKWENEKDDEAEEGR